MSVKFYCRASAVAVSFGLFMVPSAAFAQFDLGDLLSDKNTQDAVKGMFGQQSQVSNIPPSPVSNLTTTELARRDVVNSTIKGAVIGGVAGAVIGNNTGDGNAKKGATVGAIIGGVSGFVAGNVAAQRRQAFSTESAFLENEIVETETAIQVKTSQLQQANYELAQTQQRVDDIANRHNQNLNVQDEARAEKSALEQRIAGYESTLATYQESIDYLSELESSQQSQPGDDYATLQAKRSNLTKKKLALVSQFNELNGIKDQSVMALNKLNTVAAS